MYKRDFLKLSALSVGSLLLAESCTSVPLVKNYSGLNPSGSKGKLLLVLRGPKSSPLSRVCSFDLDTNELQDLFVVPVNLPHSFVQNKNNPNEFFFFELYRSSGKFDAATKSFTKTDLKTSRNISFGHGLISPTGKQIFCTELNRETMSAEINIRSIDGMEKVGKFPAEIGDHSIVLLPGTSITACGSSALDYKNRKLIFYDCVSKKIINSVQTGFPISHLVPLSSTEVIALSYFGAKKIEYANTKIQSESNVRGLIKEIAKDKEGFDEADTLNFMRQLDWNPSHFCIVSIDGRKKNFWDEKQENLFRFNFGATYEKNSDQFITTHLASNTIIIWKDFKIQKTLSVPSPTLVTVSLDATEFYVLSGGETLHRFSLKSLKELPAPPIPAPLYMSIYS